MKAQLKIHNGTPTVFLDDKPVFFGFHLIGGASVENMKLHRPYVERYKEAGVRLYSTGVTQAIWAPPRAGEDYAYDFSTVRPEMQSYLDIDPEAVFLMRINFDTRWVPDRWWNDAYTEEVEVLSNGERWGNSFASRIWREQVNHQLRAFMDHLREIGMYERVLAYQIGAGSSGEWIKDMSCMRLPSGDFSPTMRRHFQAWLRERYDDDESALRAEWSDNDVTFETAQVPPHADQSSTATGLSFRDPRRERKIIDYYECYAEVCADDLIDFCRTVRQYTMGEKLAGGFFGYVLDLAWNMTFFSGEGTPEEAEVSTLQRSGHLGLRRLLTSPDVDFVVSPHGYAFRGLGGDGLPMQPAESLRHHGKIYVMEEDEIMHNNKDVYGRMHSEENAVAVYQRNFAQVLTHGHAVTWFETDELHASDRLAPERMRWISRFQQLGQWGVNLDRKPASDVGVFLDLESYMYESNFTNVDLPLIWRQRVVSLNRFGASHDIYLLDDLIEDDLPPYKLYVFLNPFHLDDRRRNRLKSILRRDGRTALWLYAPGLLNRDAGAHEPVLSVDHMTDLTGLRFVQCDGSWAPLMHLTNFEHPVTRGLPQDWFWGSTNPIAPTFHLEDPDATTLGQTVYTLGRCRPGLGLRTFNPGTPADSWTSVYCASPDIPGPVLRGIARHAGVHLYNEDGDVLYATAELLSVHTVAGGRRIFQLPKPVEVVYDLFHQQTLAEGVGEFSVKLSPASTALYFAGERRVLEALPEFR